jgi:eukaryotic-like serine/threonine-protein kinase
MTAWDAERWHAATGELDRMLGQSGAERAAALDALRARDPRLADDVAKLLRDHASAQAGGFLEQGPDALLTTASAPAATPGPRPPSAAALPAGAELGGYRVRRVLGRGGMGLVYEAEEIESGRRVALKVLEQRFGDERERERFEREGRLAASIDHEHCVFVFGAAEIHGVPAIAMELMQGTLADRLAAEGPLPPAAAVDVALQLVAGLRAAEEAGILHRDVKPSNCFVDADGVVKIGDFGISRSTRPADDAATATPGVISATPMYASPEQLRGEAVDVRSDIYSLGATLYELLTGRRPFAAEDLMALLTQVASATPTSPHAIDGAIPRGLSDIVLRCMAKRPEQRFADYAALAVALAPYGTIAPTPATVGRRLLAGVIDNVVLGAIQRALFVTVLMPTNGTLPRLPWLLGAMAPPLLYYGLSEGFWARSPGKALCGLAVVDARGRPVRAGRALIRAALFIVAGFVIAMAYLRASPDPMERMRLGPVGKLAHDHGIYVVFLGVVFLTARRRNGYAALHDLASGTRVVAAQDQPVLAGRPPAPAPTGSDPVIERHGAFVVHDAAIPGLDGWRSGFDERLRRRVWVRQLPPDTPPIAAERAALSRPTRLRWLAGRRGDGRAWDVYESAPGKSLAHACATPRRWREVHGWLLDLAQELVAQGPGDRPPLQLDRIRILDSGHAKLLDDPTSDRDADARAAEPATLLRGVACLARRHATAPWPVAAERFVGALGSQEPPDAGEALRTLQALGGRDAVSPAWRAMSLAAQVVVPLLLAADPLLTMATSTHSATPSAASAVFLLVDALEAADRGELAIAPADREAIELVLASRSRAAATEVARRLDQDPNRSRSARVAAVLERHPTDAGATVAATRPFVHSILEPIRRSGAPAPMYAALLIYDGLVKIALLALASAILARSALIRLLGFEVVTAGGPASRLRVTARTAIAWAAVLGPAAGFAAVSGDWFVTVATHMWVVYVALLVQVAGATLAIVRPARGLQDRLAGTWIVPR